MTLPVPGDPSRGTAALEGGAGPVFTYPYATGDLVDALLALQAAATRGVNPDWYEPVPAADMVACTSGDGFTVTALTRDGRMVGLAAAGPTHTGGLAAHIEGVVVLPKDRRASRVRPLCRSWSRGRTSPTPWSLTPGSASH